MTQQALAWDGREPYRCIAMDPPWPERGGGHRGAQEHYEVMAPAEIQALVLTCEPVSCLAPDCHCWIWVTDNYLEDGLALMRALGFRYIRTLCWVKVKRPRGLAAWMRWLLTEFASADNAIQALRRAVDIGLGQYLRGSHELALFGVRGAAMVPPPDRRRPSVVFAPRGTHSAKPDEAVAVMEAVSPGPRVELFARRARPGWDLWGNQAPGA